MTRTDVMKGNLTIRVVDNFFTKASEQDRAKLQTMLSAGTAITKCVSRDFESLRDLLADTFTQSEVIEAIKKKDSYATGGESLSAKVKGN